MKSDDQDFEQHIKRLLADPSYRDHPLYIALACLWQQHREQLTRLERITSLSDAYQALARTRELSLSERFDKQVRQLEKVVRISDRYQEMMRDLNLALKEASTHDPLTGLANRRLLLDRLKEETERYTRNGHTFVLAMLDVDYFKQVNDKHGHDVGDKVLQAIARTMQAELREYDVCGRWWRGIFVSAAGNQSAGRTGRDCPRPSGHTRAGRAQWRCGDYCHLQHRCRRAPRGRKLCRYA